MDVQTRIHFSSSVYTKKNCSNLDVQTRIHFSSSVYTKKNCSNLDVQTRIRFSSSVYTKKNCSNLDVQTRIHFSSSVYAKKNCSNLDVQTRIHLFILCLNLEKLLKCGCSNQNSAIFCSILRGRGFRVWNIHHWHLDAKSQSLKPKRVTVTDLSRVFCRYLLARWWLRSASSRACRCLCACTFVDSSIRLHTQQHSHISLFLCVGDVCTRYGHCSCQNCENLRKLINRSTSQPIIPGWSDLLPVPCR